MSAAPHTFRRSQIEGRDSSHAIPECQKCEVNSHSVPSGERCAEIRSINLIKSSVAECGVQSEECGVRSEGSGRGKICLLLTELVLIKWRCRPRRRTKTATSAPTMLGKKFSEYFVGLLWPAPSLHRPPPPSTALDRPRQIPSL